ncbi:MAG: hypothetical protein WBZ36_02810 [Candidatus Nitrosopolaris sp.]
MKTDAWTQTRVNLRNIFLIVLYEPSFVVEISVMFPPEQIMQAVVVIISS